MTCGALTNICKFLLVDRVKDKIAGFGLFSPYIELMFITSRVGFFACKFQYLKTVKNKVLLFCEELKWTE